MTDLHFTVVTRATISPALPHLHGAVGGAIAIERAVSGSAPDQGALEDLLPQALAEVAAAVARVIPVHPERPSWSARRYLEHREFAHDVNVGKYPYLTPTPAEPGHTPGSWLDCQLCRDSLIEEAPE